MCQPDMEQHEVGTPNRVPAAGLLCSLPSKLGQVWANCRTRKSALVVDIPVGLPGRGSFFSGADQSEFPARACQFSFVCAGRLLRPVQARPAATYPLKERVWPP